MRPVSDALLDTLRGPHQTSCQAVVCTTFQTGVEPTGVTLQVVDGTVTLDGNAALRSSVDLTVNGERAWPQLVDDLLAPYGNEVYINVGILHARNELIGLGYHRIKSIDQDNPPDGPIRLECEDRMAAIIQARLLAPRQFLAGTTLGLIMNTLVGEIYPTAVIEWDDATDALTLARTIIVEEDRHGFLDDMVRAQGKIWYFDHRGVLVIRALPSATAPVFVLNAGVRGVLVSMSRHLTREGVYNAVVATGEGGDSSQTAYGTATDDSPASPTYFMGRFGQVPQFYSSPLLTSNAQARQAAASILRRQLGLPYVVDFGAVTNPALEPYDTVTIRYSTRDAPETHIIERLTIPLIEARSMTGATRKQAITLIGTA